MLCGSHGGKKITPVGDLCNTKINERKIRNPERIMLFMLDQLKGQNMAATQTKLN